MYVEGVLKTDALIRHVGKDIAEVGRYVESRRIDFRTPKVRRQAVAVRIKIKFARLLLIVHVPKVDKTHPSFFGIGILPTVQNIELFTQRIVDKPVIIHVILRDSGIRMEKKTAAPLLRKMGVS